MSERKRTKFHYIIAIAILLLTLAFYLPAEAAEVERRGHTAVGGEECILIIGLVGSGAILAPEKGKHGKSKRGGD
jgi:hypothetical protein